MKHSVLLVNTIWILAVTCRRLTNDLENDILGNSAQTGIGMTSERLRDWVKISHLPPAFVHRSMGARLELECEAMGSPAPVMQWLRGNIPLTENESFDTNLINDAPSHGMAKAKSRLVINSALPVHDGTFTCLAEAGSQVATAQTTLVVDKNVLSGRNFTQLLTGEILGARSPARIVLFYTSYLDVIGSDIVLPCKAVGNPVPDVIWLDPSESVINSAKTDGHLSVLSGGDLRIRSVRWDDMGVYTCLARNALGQDTITAFVYPMLSD